MPELIKMREKLARQERWRAALEEHLVKRAEQAHVVVEQY